MSALRTKTNGVDRGITQQIVVHRRGGGAFQQFHPVAMFPQRSGKARLQIERELAAGTLMALPAPPLYRDLYWHRWVLERGIHWQISQAILQHGAACLLPFADAER